MDKQSMVAKAQLSRRIAACLGAPCLMNLHNRARIMDVAVKAPGFESVPHAAQQLILRAETELQQKKPLDWAEVTDSNPGAQKRWREGPIAQRHVVPQLIKTPHPQVDAGHFLATAQMERVSAGGRLNETYHATYNGHEYFVKRLTGMAQEGRADEAIANNHATSEIFNKIGLDDLAMPFQSVNMDGVPAIIQEWNEGEPMGGKGALADDVMAEERFESVPLSRRADMAVASYLLCDIDRHINNFYWTGKPEEAKMNDFDFAFDHRRRGMDSGVIELGFNHEPGGWHEVRANSKLLARISLHRNEIEQIAHRYGVEGERFHALEQRLDVLERLGMLKSPTLGDMALMDDALVDGPRY